MEHDTGYMGPMSGMICIFLATEFFFLLAHPFLRMDGSCLKRGRNFGAGHVTTRPSDTYVHVCFYSSLYISMT